MKLNLKQIKIIAIFGIFLISFFSHFIYSFIPNTFFSFFFPVNESIWEHMKIPFTSTLIYGIIDYILLKNNNINYHNFPFQLWFTSIITIPIYLIVYLPIYKLIGENLVISILLLFIVYTISQYISYKILKYKELKILNNITILVILSIYVLFIYLTYNPPHTYLFYDITKNDYGIIEKNKISK